MAKCLELSKDKFGNYVVQHLLSCVPACSSEIIVCLQPHMPALAISRSGSHVVQKALNMSNNQQAAAILNQFLSQICESFLWALQGPKNKCVGPCMAPTQDS